MLKTIEFVKDYLMCTSKTQIFAIVIAKTRLSYSLCFSSKYLYKSCLKLPTSTEVEGKEGVQSYLPKISQSKVGIEFTKQNILYPQSETQIAS